MTIIDLSHGSTSTYLVEERHNLIPPCIVCDEFRPVLLDSGEYFAYFMRGQHAQDAFPTLTPAQREVMITGVHPECWAVLFGSE